MLAPKKVKHRKMHKGRMRGKAYRGCQVTLGDYGLKALEPGWITKGRVAVETHAIHVKNLRGLTTVELEEKVKELKKELFNLRFQFVAGRVENPAKIKQTKREIARLKTIIRETQRSEAATSSRGA